jgi:hypothetical protein
VKQGEPKIQLGAVIAPWFGREVNPQVFAHSSLLGDPCNGNSKCAIWSTRSS